MWRTTHPKEVPESHAWIVIARMALPLDVHGSWRASVLSDGPSSCLALLGLVDLDAAEQGLVAMRRAGFLVGSEIHVFARLTERVAVPTDVFALFDADARSLLKWPRLLTL